jgi:hypothetical protein
VLPVRGIACYRVFAAAAFAILLGALFAIFPGAAIHCGLSSFAVLRAAGHFLACAARRGFRIFALVIRFVAAGAGGCGGRFCGIYL